MKRKNVKRTQLRRNERAFPDGQFTEPVEAEYLPMHNIMKIARAAVPAKTKFTKKFQLLLSTIVSEFLHLIAAKLHLSFPEKKVVNDEDCIQLIESLGIQQYSTILKVFMSDYRELTFNTLLQRINRLGAGDTLRVLTGGEEGKGG